jgi:hypothetical protein
LTQVNVSSSFGTNKYSLARTGSSGMAIKHYNHEMGGVERAVGYVQDTRMAP